MVRFLFVSMAGLALDLTVAWSAVNLLPVPLWFAAGIGFLVAASFNYVLHEFWTFRDGARQLSIARAFCYGAALVATLITRIAIVAVLAGLLDGRYAFFILVAGAGGSFCVTYLFSKYLVFRRKPESKDSPL